MGAWTPPSGTTPGIRRPVRTITRPPISSRRIRFGEPTSSLPSGVIVAASGQPLLANRRGRLVDDLVLRRPPVVERKVVAVEVDVEPGHVGSRTWSASSSSPVRSRPLRGRRSSQSACVGSWAWVHGSHGAERRLAPEGPQGALPVLDARGKRITDPEKIERIEALVIRLRGGTSGSRHAESEAPGDGSRPRRATPVPLPPRVSSSGSARSSTSLVRFAERLPDLRKAMSKDMDGEPLSPEDLRAGAAPDQPRLVSRRHRALREDDSYLRDHDVAKAARERSRISFRYRAKHSVRVRTAIVDAELAAAMKSSCKSAAAAGCSATARTVRSGRSPAHG